MPTANLIQPLTLSAEVDRIIVNMKRFGVLCAMEGHRLDDNRPAVIVYCADGLYADDLRGRHKALKISSGLCEQPLLQNLSWHGGALVLAQDSPLNASPDEDHVFFHQVEKAVALGYQAVALYAHVPCKGANACNLGFWQLMECLMAAKARVKAIGDGVVASAFLHIDPLNAEMEACYINRQRWEEWLRHEANPDEHIKIAA